MAVVVEEVKQGWRRESGPHMLGRGADRVQGSVVRHPMMPHGLDLSTAYPLAQVISLLAWVC
jgi:hypothetical protein